MSKHRRVVVVGAGFAGLGAAMRLAESGEHSFTVLEQAAEIGGTWRDNVYPGVACDVPSHLYSFSFAPRTDWSRRYAEGPEILRYLRSCAETPGVRERLRTGTGLREARWSQQRGLWELSTTTGALTAEFLVLATGRFNEPHIPAMTGLADFAGPIMHTARWRSGMELAGRRVGVVGTGASAVQLVPELVAAGAAVTVFQRSAPWVIPKADTAYSASEQELFARWDAARRAHRQEIFAELDRGFPARLRGSAENTELRDRALRHLHEQISEPKLRARLTPDYAIGCKRVLLSDAWYPALSSGSVTVEDSALASLSPTTATAESGNQHRLDALVLATGFQASRPAIAQRVRGRLGVLLSDHWEQGMSSYASTAVSGFPNSFLLGGPNAALGHNSALTMLETQINHLLSALEQLPPGSICEVRGAAERGYTAMLDSRAAQTVWTAQGCSSWYRDPATGRVTLLWPGSAAEYSRRYAKFDPAAYHLQARSDTAVGPARGADEMSLL